MTIMPGPANSPDGVDRPRIISYVSGGYFAALGTRLLAGRPFTDDDTATGLRVVIVDEKSAALLSPGRDIVGRCLPLTPASPGCVTVVGVSESRRMAQVSSTSYEFFYPIGQAPEDAVPQALMIRPTARPAVALDAVSAAIRAAVPGLPAVTVRPLEQMVNTRARSWRVGAAMFGIFGTFAVVLAAFGIYGTLAFTTRQRTSEIGVRIALGARPMDVSAVVLSQALVPLALGWIIGLSVTFAAAGGLRALLFQVSPVDPWALGTASVTLVAAGLAGSAVPVLRAVHIDPITALRRD